MSNWKEKIQNITPDTIFQKVNNAPGWLKGGVIFLLCLFSISLILIGQFRNHPIAARQEFLDQQDESVLNFTVNQTLPLGDDEVIHIISFNTEDGWFASFWDPKSVEEINRSPIQNTIAITHPIAVGQVVGFLLDEGVYIESIDITEDGKLFVNGLEVQGEPYNTQLTHIVVDGEEYRLPKFYNTLMQQRGQLDLLNKYNIDTDDIAMSHVNPNGTVEFFYNKTLWEFKTVGETVELRYE